MCPPVFTLELRYLVAPKPLPTGGPLRGPPVGRGFRAAGATGTPKIDVSGRPPSLEALVLAVLKAKIKIKNPRIRAGIGPKPTISPGKWQSGPSPGTPRGRGGGAKKKITKHLKNIQVV
jgi:hypothetical protein